MPRRLTVVVSQGQSASPAKRKLEEDLVAALLFEPGVEVAVVPHLYDLQPDGTGMLCLQGITGDIVVLSWLYPRAAHWVLDRNNVRGHFGQTLLKGGSESEDDESEDDDRQAEDSSDDRPEHPVRELPNRRIYHLDLRLHADPQPYLDEIRRVAREATVQTVDLLGWIGGQPRPEQLQRFVQPAPGNVESNGGGQEHAATGVPLMAAPGSGQASGPPPGSNGPLRIDEEAPRRWYPVIDYSRCTNCMECLDFCLFGVYGVDKAEAILVEQPDNCRKGCPACSRVCPENAIIFPQHKTPAIAGSPDGAAGSFKIDLSKLFGAPDGVQQAVLERDTELVAAGREAVGMTVGIPKRQTEKPSAPKDELDDLIDQLDGLEL